MKKNKVVLLFLLFLSIISYTQENNKIKRIEKIKRAKKKLNLKERNKEQADNCYFIGYNYNKLNKIDSAYKYFSISKSIHESLNDSLTVALRLFSIGKIESKKELFFKSDSTLVLALKYLNNKKEESEITTSIYNTLGINSSIEGKYDQVIKWYTDAMKLTKDSTKIIRYLNNIGYNSILLGEYEKAIETYKRIEESYFFKKIDSSLKGKVIDNFNYAKFLSGRSIRESDFLEAQKIKKSINDIDGLITNYSYLSDFFKNTNKVKSREYACKMYDLTVKYDRFNDRIIAIDKILELSKESELKKLVIERSKVKDSIVLAHKRTVNKFVKTMYNYEEEKKQKLEARAELAESNLSLEQQKSQKQLLGFAVILTILSSIVYFFYKREKNKKEKAIEVYNTETRLSKKIHDELANDVYAVMNTLQNKAETDTKLLARVEKIYAQTRDISHENSPVLTGEHFESFLKQLFIDFTNDTCKVIHKGLKEVVVNELPKEKQIVLYRVLRELLVNMKKHSEASLVLITFSLSKKMLSVAYQDNGKGVKSLSIKNGLQNMETRIKSVGGIITFESKQEKGFQAKFHFKK
ncbi:tetratricopeptide repeat-containing sensor histidine kinase [Tenacibaculum singaporense]|uniref:tetratricopeptide repeat-containing sensor histidine kinase n=1 Tax=Tenacibaculum singaporense TaxID=2358479 RepID=UPI000F6632E6|nr:tetratricopeptide repeat-containing sensor histidine kinase [Tenacibaculum singaporense]RSC92258.1 tetratricopeptide repeat-containing sensor histidine kinase [Tenacibaculum singaporense]